MEKSRIAVWLTAAIISIGAASEMTLAQPAPVTDKAIRASIDKATAFLYSRQKPDGSIPNRHSGEYVGGGEALAAYALLTAGQSPDNPKLRRTLEYLKARQPGHTYTRSFRAIAFSRLKGDDYKSVLTGDVKWLTKYQHRNGGWGYGSASAMARLKPEWTDASNSQLAILALREASESGIPVPRTVWMKAEPYWRRLRNKDGGWGYQPPIAGKPPQRADSHGSMTAAGVASFFILADKLSYLREQGFGPDKRSTGGRLAFSRQIRGGLAWLKTNYKIDKNPRYIWMATQGQLYYYLFCLQRAGYEAGMRTFASHDYTEEMCRLLMDRQKPDGAWGSSAIDTSFALLCMAKASAPIIINRLELKKPPGTDPLDAANITRWMSRTLGKPLAWQQTDSKMPGEFPAGTLLYINGDSPAKYNMSKKFKRFIRNGGTCLVQPRLGDKKSTEAFQRYFLGLFPDYRRQDIGPDHPIFNLRFQIADEHRPKIIGIGDGCRTRIFILAEDVSGAWHQGRRRKYEHLFALAGNIILYSGGGKLPPGRFAARQKTTPPPVKRFINVARLKYKGDYNVCPLAISRLSGALARSLSVGLKELPPADPAKQIAPSITLLWLTGNTPPKFSKTELTNIRKYLESGGTLLIDPAIGRGDFHAAAGKMLEEMFGKDALRPLKPASPIITGSFASGLGADAGKVRLTQRAGADAKPTSPKLQAVLLNKRIAVVLSAYGLTCSIEGNPCVENIGYVTDDARKIALNVILYAATNRALSEK